MMTVEYSDKDKQEILLTQDQINAIKAAMESDWWKITMAAMETELWATLDELKTISWTLESLAKICGKVYAIRAFMESHKDILGFEESIREAIKNIE